MAKFRFNHEKEKGKGRGGGGGLFSKSAVFAAIVAGLFYLFNQGYEDGSQATKNDGQRIEIDFADGDYNLPEEFFPTSTTGEIVQHTYYAMSYNEEHEQPEWVAYELTKENIQAKNVKRSGNFRPDPRVAKGSASKSDYKHSGYDRGHLVPAGDMNFNKKAMSETFYMSNMSPQIKNFNGGIWRELEENVRDWAYRNEHLYIVSGPVLTKPIREQIGGNKVSVPEEYYKVILDYTGREQKAIAFLMPNEKSNKRIMDHAVSIDEVERVTGIDFFPNMDEADESKLEANFDPKKWTVDRRKEEDRIEKWNNR